MFTTGEIDGIVLRELVVHSDNRGTLVETYRADELPVSLQPQMSYVSHTVPGVARGPHEHRDQTDIFIFMGPGDFEVFLWDNRKESATYGTRMIVEGGTTRPIFLMVPPGIVHGYRNVSKEENGMVLNYPNRLYRGWKKEEEVDEIRHEDGRDQFYEDFVAGVEKGS